MKDSQSIAQADPQISKNQPIYLPEHQAEVGQLALGNGSKDGEPEKRFWMENGQVSERT